MSWLDDMADWFGEQRVRYSGAGYEAQLAGEEAQRDRDFQEAMQREQWQRDDTSVQRRVADLEAAGLNPVLAAGGAGAPSSPLSKMPEVGAAQTRARSDALSRSQQSASLMMQMLRMKSDISKTLAETEYIESQKDKQETLNKFLSEKESLDLGMMRDKAAYSRAVEGARADLLSAQALSQSSIHGRLLRAEEAIRKHGVDPSEVDALKAKLQSEELVRNPKAGTVEMVAAELAVDLLRKKVKWFDVGEGASLGTKALGMLLRILMSGGM